MKLTYSKVRFDSDTHTYTLDGKELSGITSLLDRQLFKDKYSGVPDEILQKAADRGTLIHQQCEMADEGFPVTSEEAINYMLLKQKYNLRHEESEYLVSDNENYASCIDKVYRYDENTFFLGDIKTTYKLNKEYVQWQLSIYAHLFEKQNKGAKVSSIFAIWLRGTTHQLVVLERIPDEKVEKLLYCDSRGLQYIENLPVVTSEAEKLIIDIESQIKALTEKKKAIQDAIMQAMVKAGSYSYRSENLSITRKTASTRKSFDKERFDKDYPNVYDKYIKETPVAESLLIKIK